MTHKPHPGRVALVTGAARGIGAATAIALAQRGIAPVLLVRDALAASATKQAVTALGVTCGVLQADVADAAQVQQALAQLLRDHGRLDVLVNNAGQIDPIGRMADTDPAAWTRAIEVNLLGPYFLIQAALPALLASSQAVVLNVSTGAAHTPREGWSAYCTSKAGLCMLTRSLAHEYAAQGVAVYGLQPGLVDTAMQGQIRASGMNEISRIPREQLAAPEHAAALIAWLCDRRPAQFIGQDLSLRDEVLLQQFQQ